MKYATPHPRILEQAEHWFSRLQSGECSPQERMAFRHWRAMHPDHAVAYAEVERLWRRAGEASEDPEIQSLMDQVWAETAPAKSGRPAVGRLRLAALAAGVAVASVALGVVMLLGEGDRYATALGERLTVTLEDGSVVTLNTDTRLRVRYTDERRMLELRRGEALFQVARDPDRPFHVSAGEGRVTALGTRFQVRRDGDRIEVVLLEGKVAVEHAASVESPRLEMQPGERVQIASASPVMEARPADREAALSWTQGRMVFRATPLHEVVDEANRYARTKIRIADDELRELRISGTFVTGDSELLVTALEADMPVVADFSRRAEIVLHARRR